MRVQQKCLIIVPFWAICAFGSAINVNLGSADPFAVLAGSAITNTGVSNISGSIGVWPGSSIGGFPPGVQTGGTMYFTDAVALLAQGDLTTAYNAAAGQSCDTSLTGQDLGGLTLTPGVYCFSSSAQLTGTVTLDAQGDSSAAFVFQIGSTLTTASNSAVSFVNAGQGGSVFWQVGSSATLGTTTAFAGNILALTDITLNTGASIQCGRALARNGAVTMDTNDISINTAGCEATTGGTGAVPEPGTAALLGLGSSFGLFFLARGFRAGATVAGVS